MLRYTGPRRLTASMGPRPFGRGRVPRFFVLHRGAAPLQWGRDLSVAEGKDQAGFIVDVHVLQWGRDLSVAEGAWRAQISDAPGGASMGPRPFGRGRVWRCPLRAGRVSASMGPRPFGRGRRQAARLPAEGMTLQWGRDLSVAEGSLSAQGAAPQVCFNGAATFRSRKGVHEPESGRRPDSFNGAATFRSRKEGKACRTRLYRRRFNGAATFRSRKDGGRYHSPGNRAASMGPRPFGRGR